MPFTKDQFLITKTGLVCKYIGYSLIETDEEYLKDAGNPTNNCYVGIHPFNLAAILEKAKWSISHQKWTMETMTAIETIQLLFSITALEPKDYK